MKGTCLTKEILICGSFFRFTEDHLKCCETALGGRLASLLYIDIARRDTTRKSVKGRVQNKRAVFQNIPGKACVWCSRAFAMVL